MADVRIVGYFRQSMDRTGDEAAVSRQREDAFKLADVRGWTIDEEFVDNDISASGKRKRPRFDALIAAIEAGGIQAVIAWDLTRLTRNAADRVRLINACSRTKTTIALVRGSDIDPATPAGKLVAGILGEVAEHEIAQKSDRQKRASEQLVAAGKPSAGRRVFGFEADKITIRESEAGPLRKAYESVLHRVPLTRIADDLNRAGAVTTQTTRTGEVSQWSAQTLRPTLLNPRYCGLRAVTVRGEVGRPTWDIRGKAVWSAIVPEDTWRAAAAILTDPERYFGQVRHATALLTGVALCGAGDCDSTVNAGRNKDGKRIYRCRDNYGHVSRMADPVDLLIEGLIVERLGQPDAMDLLNSDASVNVPALRTEAESLRVRLDDLAADFAEGRLTRSQLRIGTEVARRRLAEIEDELMSVVQVDRLSELVTSSDVAKTWNDLDLDRRRGIVDALVAVRLLPPGRGTRTFRPETVQIAWKN